MKGTRERGFCVSIDTAGLGVEGALQLCQLSYIIADSAAVTSMRTMTIE